MTVSITGTNCENILGNKRPSSDIESIATDFVVACHSDLGHMNISHSSIPPQADCEMIAEGRAVNNHSFER
jgi:hypothetical protein